MNRKFASSRRQAVRWTLGAACLAAALPAAWAQAAPFKVGLILPMTGPFASTGRQIDAEMGVLPRMRIGGLRVEGLSIAWTEAHPFKIFGLSKKPAMLLGMDLLRSFERVSVDFGNKKVRFMPREQGRRGLARGDAAKGGAG